MLCVSETSDYKKLVKINEKIEESNNSDNIIRKNDGKLSIKECKFHLQETAKIMEKPKKNEQDIKAWARMKKLNCFLGLN